MPNYCANRLTIFGSIKDRKDFLSAVKTEKSLFTFNNIVPEPTDDDDGWYNWRIENWGCKWDASDTKIEQDDDEKTVLTFLTAWAPPNSKFMSILASQFPSLAFDLRFAERGVEFYGYWTKDKNQTWNFQNDDIIQTDEDDYTLREGLHQYKDLFERSG